MSLKKIKFNIFKGDDWESTFYYISSLRCHKPSRSTILNFFFNFTPLQKVVTKFTPYNFFLNIKLAKLKIV